MKYRDYLIENIPDTVKHGEKTPEGIEIAKKLGLKYNGVQKGCRFGERIFPDKHVFTDLSGKANHTTFMASSFEEAKNTLEKHIKTHEEMKKQKSFSTFYQDNKKLKENLSDEPELTAKEYTDDKGNTQLHKEITRSDSKYLLKHEDVAKLKNKRGETPLHLAAWHHKEAISHPHASTVRDDEKVTPLHNAAEPFKEVLNHPDVSKVKDSDGVTPLHIAAIYHPDASKHPDYTKVKDNRGLTPKDFAEGKG